MTRNVATNTTGSEKTFVYPVIQHIIFNNVNSSIGSATFSFIITGPSWQKILAECILSAHRFFESPKYAIFIKCPEFYWMR